MGSRWIPYNWTHFPLVFPACTRWFGDYLRAIRLYLPHVLLCTPLSVQSTSLGLRNPLHLHFPRCGLLRPLWKLNLLLLEDIHGFAGRPIGALSWHAMLALQSLLPVHWHEHGKLGLRGMGTHGRLVCGPWRLSLFLSYHPFIVSPPRTPQNPTPPQSVGLSAMENGSDLLQLHSSLERFNGALSRSISCYRNHCKDSCSHAFDYGDWQAGEHQATFQF